MSELPPYTMSNPTWLWSKVIRIGVSPNEFQQNVASVALAHGQRISGFTTGDETEVATFTYTRYPRRKYGVPTFATCKAIGMALAESFSTTLDHDPERSRTRVVLGLKEGYAPDAPQHTVGEVRASLGRRFAVEQGTVFALKPEAGSFSIYTEPAAIILGAAQGLRKIVTLAHETRQERFAVEDFRSGTAFMIETAHCTDPDN